MKWILLNTTCEYRNNEQRQWPTIKVKILKVTGGWN